MSFTIDKSWTLFLDRDGVINTRKMDGYIESVEEFEFSPGVLDALKILKSIFGKIVVVTNQQGIGKGLMTTSQLFEIHEHMLTEVSQYGGHIDRCYFAPDLASPDNSMRKPNGGMALQAQKDFPEIIFSKAVMVGDSDSDIEFGMNLGMKTVRIGGDDNKSPEADKHVNSLIDWVNTL